jgi:rare lipoprotein A
VNRDSSTAAKKIASLQLFCVLSAASALLALTAGCAHQQQVAYTPPAPPPAAPAESTPPGTTVPVPEPVPSGKPAAALGSDQDFVETHAPVYSETGMASWYGPPYHNREGANGEVYNENHISAAHRTLPMGSLIKVTNLRTGQSAVMHVTDRGPFVQGRILDLSMAAAKAVGVWGPGVAQVRIDVYSTPRPLDTGGRWCVQIGAFPHLGAARHLQEKLQHEYESANVIEFEGPTGYWVRIRPAHDDRTVATEIANRVHPSDGEAWLVRLD